MRRILVAVLLVAACGSNKNEKRAEPTKVEDKAEQTPVAPPPAGSATPAAGSGSAVVGTPETKPVEEPTEGAPAPGGHDFTPEAKALLAVGACGGGPTPEGVPQSLVDKHCSVITKAQDEYKNGWLKKAEPFFEQKVPKDLPKKVLYPFAGGDLSTALTVYPDADEITTISLEPPGDPRTLGALKGKALENALGKVEYELKFLYRVNFSNTLNMIEAMRGGALPTQLIFGLSALKIHGYELVALRYFKLNEDGTIHYLDDADLKKAPDPEKGTAEQRNSVFSNCEVQFRKPGGRIQVWRHMKHNLGDAAMAGIGPGLKEDPRIVKHLEAKGDIAGMTKAASYLLSWDSFTIIRKLLLDHVQWMVSDATGVAPKWGKAAGFEYETYGLFEAPHIGAGNNIAKNWKEEWAAQDKRELTFRFGYYDKKFRNHLVIMRKKKAS
ncbi:MAG TPA: hypothetical protein VL326_22030 [Kofleriaceae bacterium]|nr:hypothetical protein [Kofleriaceae bacterium]